MQKFDKGTQRMSAFKKQDARLVLQHPLHDGGAAAQVADKKRFRIDRRIKVIYRKQLRIYRYDRVGRNTLRAERGKSRIRCDDIIRIPVPF